MAVAEPETERPASSDLNNEVKKESDGSAVAAAEPQDGGEQMEYPHGFRLFLIMFALLLSMFLVRWPCPAVLRGCLD